MILQIGLYSTQLEDQDKDETMDNQMMLSMIECLCKSISFLVQWATDNERRKALLACGSCDVQNDSKHTGEHDFTARIIALSKVVMEFLESDNVSNLAHHKFDIYLGCLLDLYRMPSVANGFETDTVAFYDWWIRLENSFLCTSRASSKRRKRTDSDGRKGRIR